MRRLILLIVLTFAGSSMAQPPQSKPLDAKDAQKLFKLDDGLRIELVACEPQIESPVAMAFDPDGRLWVVEMRDYPNGPAKGEKPMGRIRILEDKDGDGFFETSTIWADELPFANGLLLWKDGAIVTMAPYIVHVRHYKSKLMKTSKAEAVILYDGFAEQNPQLRVSHPTLGPDGWIYCANGLRGGKVHRFAPRSPDEGSWPRVDLSGMDFRFDPVDLSKYEAITGPGQYGLTFDEWGNRFICDNRHHLRHVVMEQRYVKRNPYLAAPALVEDISVLEDGPLSSGGKVYPISKNWTTSSLHEGRFTAACGVFIYHGGLLGKPRGEVPRTPGTSPGFGVPQPGASKSIYHGAAFTCEPTGNLVHMEILTPKGATFTSKPHKKGVEFLATTDDWFRPVFLTHGPEGAMYVVDMYRAVIEHPEFMPPELKNRPDLLAGRDKGRIWRIVPKDHKTKTPRPGLSKASIAELVKTLEHEEPWHRTTAQRLLLERNDKAMIEPLTKLLETTKSPHAKILAAWLLDRQGKLSEQNILALLQSDNIRICEHAIRIGETRFSDEKTFKKLMIAAPLGDTRFRFQLSLSIGGTDDPLVPDLLAGASLRHGKDRWTHLAVQTSLPKFALDIIINAESVLNIFPDSPPAGYEDMLRGQAMLIGAQKDIKAYSEGYVVVTRHPDKLGWFGLSGLAEGLERRGMTLLSVSEEISPIKKRMAYLGAVEKVFALAAKDIVDVKLSETDRLARLRVASHASWPTAKKVLLPVVEKEPNTELRIAALRALATQQDKEVPTLLMKLWPSAGPSVRREILEAMLRQPARVNVLLDEIEAKRMKASELDPLRTRQLTNHKDAGIRERAKKLLAENVPADRQKVHKEYQAALKLKGDVANGREVFKKHCATCHRVAGVGVDIGPDIADTRTKTLDALLFDILVPNAAIDANYVNYVVSTKDGRILTGLLTAESASSITLVRAENQKDVVLRKDIDEIASTGISLMPEGLEKGVSVQEMADLLRFLKEWRYQ